MATWIDALASAIAVAVGVGTLWRWAFAPLRRELAALRRESARIGERADALQEAMRGLGEQLQGVTHALVPLLADRYAGQAEQVADLLSTFNGAWRGVSGYERERRNPLSDDELLRFETYRVKFFERRLALTAPEWADFDGMLEKMSQEKPAPPGLPALFVLSAILGAMAGVAPGVAARRSGQAGAPRDGHGGGG